MNKYINKYDYVSFDLFDTLMFRTFSDPADVYKAVGNYYRDRCGTDISFAQERIKAENLARQLKGDVDVNIHDIYSLLSFPNKEKELLKSFECQVEIDNCVPNSTMVDILRLAKSLNKKVIITTDMYLDRATIVSILDKIGCPFDYLYISGEVGYKKHNGTLFRYILEDLKISPSVICHIGDNPVSDIKRPQELGITAFLREMPRMGEFKNYIRSNSSNLVFENLSLFCKYNLSETSLTPEKRIGYTVLGPFLYGFCQWIHDVKEHYDLEKLFFVSREGFLIYKVYKSLYPEDTNLCDYISLNRNILRLPYLSLCKENHYSDILNVLPGFDRMPIIDFIDFFEIENVDSFFSKLVSYKKTDFIFKKDVQSGRHDLLIKSILLEKREDIYNQLRLLYKYLKGKSFLGKKVGLVNNSFNGTGQYLLQQLINESDTKVVGIQFACNNQCKTRLGSDYISFIGDNRFNSVYNELFYKWSYVLEHLLFENVGTAVSLKEEGDKVNIKHAIYNNERQNEEIINCIQNYCLRFIADYQKNCKFPLKSEGIAIFKDFMSKPLYEDAVLVGALYDDDEVDKGTIIDGSVKFQIQYLLSRNIPKRIKWVEGYFAIKRIPQIGIFIYKAKLYFSYYLRSVKKS